MPYQDVAWIWDVDSSISTERFSQEWDRFSAWFVLEKPWRFVVNGRCVNPEWPLSGFLSEDSDGL
jgi:hypothetical protein